MTYCVGVQVDDGLVFLSDSRTNAGVDQVSTFRKTTFFEMAGERVLVLLSAGNLAVSESVTGLLRERVASAKASLLTARTMSDAARLVGDAVRDVYRRDAEQLKEHGIEFNPTFIIGGQIGGEPQRLFHIYSAGNSSTGWSRPLDLAILRRDALQLALHRSIEPDDACFKVIRDGWGESLRNAFHALPDPPIR